MLSMLQIALKSFAYSFLWGFLVGFFLLFFLHLSPPKAFTQTHLLSLQSLWMHQEWAWKTYILIIFHGK